MASIRIGLAMALGAGAGAQLAPAQEAKPPVTALAAVSAVESEPAVGTVFRQIDDPGSNLQWLLEEDPSHPGGPGRLVPLASGKAEPRQAIAKTVPENPVIHAGDAVQVEEHTAVVDASLQAVALGSAIPGGSLRVRLRIGGRVVRARALAAGRAELEPTGERP